MKGCLQVLDPVSLLEGAWSKVKEKEGLKGSCTACIVCLERGTGTVRAVNLGDSGFMIVRPITFDHRKIVGSFGEHPDYNINLKTKAVLNRAPIRCETVHRSYPLEHTLGHPYQLGHHANTDTPDQSEKVEVDVIQGDWIVVGSDGLWDNLFDEEISQVVSLDPRSAPTHIPHPGACRRGSCANT